MLELPSAIRPDGRVHVRSRGRRLLFFGGCDYFRLSSHPAVLEAAAQTLALGGLNVAASRMTTGNHPVYERLERSLARHFRAETAVLASSGYATALLVAQALAGSVTHVLLDEKAHGCLRDAAQWLNLPTHLFRHRDAEDLQTRLAQLPTTAQPLVATDGMFAADGALAPLRELQAVLPKNAWLWIDDSHGAGALGNHGRGTLEELGFVPVGSSRRLVRTLTLSKALGCYGGAVLCSRPLRNRIVERSRCFTGNTPLPPLCAAAALTAIDLLRRDKTLRRRLRDNTARLRSALAAEGWPVADSPSPVLALTTNSVSATERLRRRMLKAGIFPSFIRYPGGPRGGFLRLAVSSEHRAEEIDRLVHSLRRD